MSASDCPSGKVKHATKKIGALEHIESVANRRSQSVFLQVSSMRVLSFNET
jgi:hypothetical protein